MRTLVAALCLSLIAACGGQMDLADTGEADIRAPLSFDPLTSYAAAQARAAKYAKNPMAVGLDGTSTDGATFAWRWTFQGQDRVYVAVSVGPQSVRVTSHEARAYFMGLGVFEPKDVRVDAQDAVSLLAKAGNGAPSSLSLSAPLTQKMVPRWTATTSKGTFFVDGLSGDVTK